MRKTRRLLLLALVLALAGVGWIYRERRRELVRAAPPKPAPLEQNVQSSSKDWVYFKGDGDRPVLEVRAKEMEQVAGSTTVIRLKGVDLRLYKKDGKKFDHVESAEAEFDQGAAKMTAPGEVTITLAEPEVDPNAPPDVAKAQAAREHLLKIVTSQVRMTFPEGRAETDAPARFEFDRGSGEAVGANYDPQARDLRLLHDVKLHWSGSPDKKRPPMYIEAGGLVYREAEAKVHLLDRSHFERLTLKVDGATSVVTLVDGNIKNIEASKAHGVDAQPKRNLEFAAELLKMDFNAGAEVEHVLGDGGSRVTLRTPTATTALRSDQVLLNFAANDKGSLLQDALAQGKAELQSKPVAANGTERILHSEGIFAKMRTVADGEAELEQVETRAPGKLDLLPAAVTRQPKRHLEATRMWMTYAAGNAMETFRAVEAKTRTDRVPKEGSTQPPVPGFTASRELTARFDVKSGAMTAMEQSGNFRYDEGAQHATADAAALDQLTQQIVLTSTNGKARSWDAAGQVLARSIMLDQATGRLVAEGDVDSTREPEANSKAGGGELLRPGEPLHGKAGRMTISDNNRVIIHEGAKLDDGKPVGRALVWQGVNRVEGARIVINRAAKTLQAEGEVTTILSDESAGKDKPTLTTVRAAKLDYAEAARLAHYTGGVRLSRPALDVRSTELRAFLGATGGSLDHLFADGAVVMTQDRPGGGSRKGSSEHAEYYTANQQVVLTGGAPTLVDSVKGSTRGDKLTYTAADETLLVEGAPAQPTTTRIKRK